MFDPIIYIAQPFMVYAMIKWWFDTTIVDTFIKILTLGKIGNLKDLKDILSEKGTLGDYLVELFECPWCLSFHFSWIVVVALNYTVGIPHLIATILATAGGAMFLWQNDLKG